MQSAFIWTHDGYSASRTRESAAGSGLAYKYELFKNQALMLHSTEHYQGNGIKTFGYYDDGKSQFGYWADSFDSMDSDSLDAIQTKTHEPVIKWEETDFRRLRSHILEEERYRITEQLLRPPKNKDEIIARQNMIDCMIHLTDFERLVEIKNASYDAMIGIKGLFRADDYESSLYDSLCAGEKRSAIVGDFREKIGENDIDASVDENVNLINHGFEKLKQVIIELRANDIGQNIKLPKIEDVEQFQSAIDKLISLNGSRNVTEIISDKNIWQDDKTEAINSFIDCCEELFMSVGMPIELARLVKDQSWCKASFNLDEPDVYTGAWNISKDKMTQTRIASPESSAPLIILSGPSTSGKSTTMGTDMLLRLATQFTGFAPAKKANIHPSDAFIAIERTGTNDRNDLSAFMNEIKAWKGAFENLADIQNTRVYADESFSTTSPEDQAELQVRTTGYLIKKFGARIMLATHNGITLTHQNISDSEKTGIFHPEVHVTEQGILKRLYKLLPGPGDSMSFLVARNRGFSTDTLKIAESYMDGDIASTYEHRPMRHFKIVDYSAEQRSEAMGVINDLASLFSNDSDDGLLRIFSDQPEKFSFDFDSSVNSNPLFSSDLLPDVAEFGLVTGNYHLKHEITKIINNTSSLLPSEILERQRLFSSLIKDEVCVQLAGIIPKLIALDFASKSLAQDIGKNFSSMNPFDKYTPLKSTNPEETIEGLYLDEFLSFFRAADAYLRLHESCFEDIDHTELKAKLHNLETATLTQAGQTTENPQPIELENEHNMSDWERELFMGTFDKAHNDLNEFLRKIGVMPQEQINPSELFRILNSNPEKRKVHVPLLKFDTGTKQKIDDFIKQLESIPFIGLKKPTIDFVRIEEKASAEHLDTITSFNNTYAQKYHEKNTIAEQLAIYKRTKNSVTSMIDILRSTDSIHLRQLANALESHHKERVESLKSGITGKTSVEFSFDEEPEKDFYSFFARQTPLPWQAKQLLHLHSLCYIASGLERQGYSQVEFNDTGEVIIEGMFNPAMLGKKEPVRNPVRFKAGEAIALIGPNGSGKTFYQKGVTAAIAVAHATGFAPATSATMPIFEKVIYIDRVTKNSEGLSSFAQEIENWKKVYKTIEQHKRPVLIGIDEPFTTTSERYQEALTYAVMTDFLRQGDHYITVASHNHRVINQLGRLITPFHFKFDIDERGFINRHFVLEPGHAPSHAFAMARTLGFPKEILSLE